MAGSDKQPGKDDKDQADEDAATIVGQGLSKTPVNADDKTHVLAQTLEPVAADHINKQDTHFTEFQSTNPSLKKGIRNAKDLVKQAAANKGRILNNRFLLETVLGQGGMGTVYKARDLRKVEAEDPNPYVAAKVLNEDFKNHPDAFISLQQEAVKSQELAHPNIVTVHDFDRDGSIIFMTMELLDGQPLDKVLSDVKGEGLPLDQACKLFNDMAEGLNYAHQRHLIHSDFKPGNVFITIADSAKVLDFGIARAAATRENRSHFDAGSLGALTPAYASLEMLTGEEPSFSDDVYALACVFYEMLCGQHPFNNMSADKALAKDIKPTRIKTLNRRQWKALSGALALRQNDRTASVAEFQKAFNPSNKAKYIGIAALLVLTSVVGLAWAVYSAYEQEKNLTIALDHALNTAKACIQQQDFACANKQSIIALNLSPQHETALVLQAQAQEGRLLLAQKTQIKQLLDKAEDCFSKEDYACARIRWQELLKLDASNKSYLQALENVSLAQQHEAIMDYLDQSEACIDKKDYRCARLFFAKAEEVDSAHARVATVDERLKNIKSQSTAAYIKRKGKIKTLFSQSQRCYQQQKYDCVITKANKILALDKHHRGAIDQIQQVKHAQQKQHDDNRIIEGFLVQATQCLARKNYSCTIAKAESALAISPKHEQSLQLKQQAEQAQQDLKKSIIIE
ncbi:MAG: serine/threonine protein kinase [Pseudomonadales bacterium]|nr:serine/threonine protein kinase [Pseudomonadales bacterium]